MTLCSICWTATDVISHELTLVSSWRNEAWNIDANRIYIPFGTATEATAGTPHQYRTHFGDGRKTGPAGLGFTLGSRHSGPRMVVSAMAGKRTMRRAMATRERVLNLALSALKKAAPVHHISWGSCQWLAEDGWSGYQDDYHMSACRNRLLDAPMARGYYPTAFRGSAATCHGLTECFCWSISCEPAGFLLLQFIVQPRAQFPRSSMREVPRPPLFLAPSERITGAPAVIVAAEKAMGLCTREVFPGSEFDSRPFYPCEKGLWLMTKWTAQFQQNRPRRDSSPSAWLALSCTGKREISRSGNHQSWIIFCSRSKSEQSLC